MEESYPEKERRILRSLVSQRLWCIKHQKGCKENDWARKELNTPEGALSTINTQVEMIRHPGRKEAVIIYLIPPRNSRQREKLKKLSTN